MLTNLDLNKINNNNNNNNNNVDEVSAADL